MKNNFKRIILYSTAVSLILLMYSCNSSKKRALIGKSDYQQRLNTSYKDGSKSPLKKKDLKTFKGLKFFPIDSSFVINANLIRIKNAASFEMATTTDRKLIYKEYGILYFKLDGKDFSLTVYQSQDDLKDEKYKDYLFLPFTDNTSGNKSYGGGRYMDLMIEDLKKDGSITVNFNNTYNPYCVYNDKYSCPLTPRKNHLDLKINAGIMAFKEN